MKIRPGRVDNSYAIAELALMAGEGIPAWFWNQSRQPGQSIEEVGAIAARSETNNFSYRNTHLAVIDHQIGGMLLAYRLPSAEKAEDLDEYPEFIRPLIELEQCVPDSFYINMLATYPAMRKQGIGIGLMRHAETLAAEKNCLLISIEVFEQNQNALRLYQNLGYRIIERREVIAHESHPYSGDIVLLVKEVMEH